MLNKQKLVHIHNKAKEHKTYWYLRQMLMILLICLKRLGDRKLRNRKPRILFYSVTGLAYGGTEKFLQVFAKHLNKKKYDVYFMYSDQNIPTLGIADFSSRLGYLLEGGVVPVPFNYESREEHHPYFIKRMSPDVFDVIDNYGIDLVVTSGAGYAEYPVSGIRHIPVMFMNIFGIPNVQRNITYHLCISEEVKHHLLPIVPEQKLVVIPVPSEGPLVKSEEAGLALRRNLGIPDDHIVFGRIGRSLDSIFDPIGIRAFQKVVERYPNVHYLIISPSPALQKIIAEEKIPNIHHVPPSGEELTMWSFYQAMDVLAHFRKDGETFGMNIAEAMFCGKPVISHRSHYWNAHLEYLDPSFSFVADYDNVEQYAEYMEVFAKDFTKEKIKSMGRVAKQKAESMFHISRQIDRFESLVESSVKNK